MKEGEAVTVIEARERLLALLTELREEGIDVRGGEAVTIRLAEIGRDPFDSRPEWIEPHGERP